MTASSAADVGAVQLTAWITEATGILRQLGPQPAPVHLAYAINGFIAARRASALLIAVTDANSNEIDNHDLVLGIALEGEPMIVEAVGAHVAGKHVHDDTDLSRFAAPLTLDVQAQMLLRRATRDISAVTRDLLTTVATGHRTPGALRATARDAAAGADVIAMIYDDDLRKARPLREAATIGQSPARQILLW
ncbi:hypothetical protein [Nocardia sp. JMUB6875]|uniref:hypothetical protein n=1 Tax=Nocardia sp. JMUB6875 TaxID=3158170 RepID=UPI0034E8856C